MLYEYRIYTRDGAEAGEAEYAVRIKPGETIWADAGKLRVVEVVPTEDDSDEYVGLLMVEAAAPTRSTS
jgi:hypothetical protein